VWNPIIRCPLHNLLGNIKTHVRILGNPGFVVGNGDHGAAVLLDERQHGFKTFILSGDGVEQCFALIDLQPGLKGGDDGGINLERYVCERLDELDGLGENFGFVCKRDSCVYVEHVGTGGDLR